MKTVTTRPYALVLAAAAVVVAGCTGDPTPPPAGAATPPASSTSTSPTPTTSSATSTTPTASTTSTAAIDPNIPPAAKAQTTDGAIAFTKYYYTLINQAWTKPQSGLLTPGSTANCKTCQGFEEDAARYVRGGTHYDRTPLEILEVSPYGPPTPGDRQLVAVTAHQVTANVVDSTGKSVESIKEVRGVFVVDVRWHGTAWKINSIKVLQ